MSTFSKMLNSDLELAGLTDTSPASTEARIDFTDTGKLRDSEIFRQQMWSIKLGGSFTKYSELCQYVAGLDQEQNAYTRADSPDKSGSLVALLKVVCGVYDFQYLGDSSLGGNEAINPMWGFNRDDDIVHPIGVTDASVSDEIGMGRFYAKTYDRNQQMLHLMFGSAYYTGLNAFVDKSIIPLAKLMSTQDGDSITGMLTKMASSGLRILIDLPFKPLHFLMSATKFGDMYGVSKFVTFRPNMVLYYRTVNSMLTTLAVGMGLGIKELSGGINEAGLRDLFATIGQPEILRDGFDIFKILSKRYVRMNRSQGRVGPTQTLDDVMSDEEGGLGSALKNIVDAGMDTGKEFSNQMWYSMMGGMHYISFRVERSDNASESISNSTGQSGIAEKMNAASQDAMEKRFEFGGMFHTGLSSVDAFTNWASNVAKGVADTITGGRSSAYFEQLLGCGFYEFPETWKGSSFSKSYSFNLHLAARSGDPVSIFQSIYVPLIMLLAAGCPRGIGSNMFTSPFMIRAYCKGQFAVPLGIIDNISINRGSGEFGWTQDYLPTAVDVSFTIRDLSPIMFLGMADKGLLSVFKNNTSMVEYLTTLSGVGLRERLYWLPAIRKRIKAKIGSLRLSTFNPQYWAAWVGSRATVQTVAAFNPWNWKTTNR